MITSWSQMTTQTFRHNLTKVRDQTASEPFAKNVEPTLDRLQLLTNEVDGGDVIESPYSPTTADVRNRALEHAEKSEGESKKELRKGILYGTGTLAAAALAGTTGGLGGVLFWGALSLFNGAATVESLLESQDQKSKAADWRGTATTVSNWAESMVQKEPDQSFWFAPSQLTRS